jgi:hypothetical protein
MIKSGFAIEAHVTWPFAIQWKSPRLEMSQRDRPVAQAAEAVQSDANSSMHFKVDSWLSGCSDEVPWVWKINNIDDCPTPEARFMEMYAVSNLVTQRNISQPIEGLKRKTPPIAVLASCERPQALRAAGATTQLTRSYAASTRDPLI